MRPGNVVRVPTRRVRSGLPIDDEDVVANEEPMEIRLYYGNDRPKHMSLSITMRTPGNDFELTAGFLFTEGIIRSRDELQRISYCVDVPAEQQYNTVNAYLAPDVAFDPSKLQRHFYTTSSCGVCGKGSLEVLRVQGCPVIRQEGPVFSDDLVRSLPGKLRQAQAIFSKTGGLHAAGLFDPEGNLLAAREDIGRHNAVDKLIGVQFLAGRTPLSNYLLQVSGRASFELMQKALVAGIPVLSAVGAPSSLAVDLAQEFGITLLGFVSEKGFNVYAGEKRIVFSRSSQDTTIKAT